MKFFLVTCVVGLTVNNVSAGLHYRGEQLRPLPAQWRGFLPDVRLLRIISANIPLGVRPAPPLRDQYSEALLILESTQKQRPLDADELADLGALYLRLGQPAKALNLLRPASRKYPEHFRIMANLGTAWQLNGELEQAESTLREAVHLAPAEKKQSEEYHVKLVQLRRKEGKVWKGTDNLFNVTFASVPGEKEQTGTLPKNATEIVQQLIWWLPSDGRLLWLMAEIAGADGDIRTAAAMLEGCISEFALDSTEARQRRVLFKTTVDALDAQEKPSVTAGRIVFRSPRVFQRTIDESKLPKIKVEGTNNLPWAVVSETEIGPRGKPIMLPYLDQLDGKTVALLGYISPIGGSKTEELTQFLFTEYPIGCWFCEMPGPVQSILVDLTEGTSTQPSRQSAKIIGTLSINRTNPEDYPFRLSNARVVVVD